jgi:rubredoxin
MTWDGTHPNPPAAPTRFEVPDLHICRSCTKPFVVPVEVLEVVGRNRYRIEFGCTNCGWSEISEQGEERMEALDRELDRQTADIQVALELFEMTCRLEEIDAFARALQADLILPEDF